MYIYIGRCYPSRGMADILRVLELDAFQGSRIKLFLSSKFFSFLFFTTSD